MTATPHDAFFKAVFSRPENALGELKAVLPPALVAAFEPGSVRLMPGSFVDERLSSRHTDLLYSVQLAGREALVYILFEHQSTIDPLLVVRVLIYVARVWDDWVANNAAATRVPPVVPVVLYHGASSWTAATELLDVIDLPEDLLVTLRPLLPSLRFVLDDLTQRQDAELRSREVAALGRLALLLLRHLRDLRPDPDRLDAFVRSVSDLLSTLSARERALTFCYILEVSERRPEALTAALQGAVGPDVLEDVMTAAEQLRREGSLRGKRSLLLRQLRAKFGQVTAEVEQRVASADEAALDAWAERVLTANSPDEVTRGAEST
ncbi:MAG: Rpn family recombination-promoting nuclease/putative transposase [Planctomycetes bacterium]|nr:Rpn family recombination-promoting nuclease/putative transposase [Planctomycetota bacterium]